MTDGHPKRDGRTLYNFGAPGQFNSVGILLVCLISVY